MSESKQKLLELEKSRLYLFHGSSESDIKELEPRQGYTIPKGKEKLIKDGEPAIAATPYADIAIFRAIVRKGKSGFSASTKSAGISISFNADKKGLDIAKNNIGYVYVLNKDGFVSMSGDDRHMEWRKATPTKPLFIYKVTYEDLPQKIKIIH